MTPGMLWLVAAFAALMVSAVLSLTHAALFSFSPAKLETLWRSKRDLSLYLDNVPRMAIASSSASTLSNLCFLACVMFYLDTDSISALLLPLTVSVIVLVLLGEVLPRTVARSFPERVLVVMIPVIHPLSILVAPVRIIFMKAGVWMADVLGENDADSSEEFAEDIKYAVEEGEKDGSIEEDEKEMIHNILEIGDVDVSQVMTPRTDMVSIDINESMDSARKLVVESGHSRLPVFDGDADNIVGILYGKDILAGLGDGPVIDIRTLMREPFFVPETKNTGDLLEELRANRVQIAIALDEHGGTAGLVSIEDVLEEIVGEIEDEHDKGQALLTITEDGAVEVDARISIRDLNEALELELPEEDGYDTLGGFVFSQLGKVPKQGDNFEWDGVGFVILGADERRVNKVKVVTSGWDRQ